LRVVLLARRARAMARIDWKDIDATTFFASQAVIFTAIRATLYPLNVLKVNLQVNAEPTYVKAYRKIRAREGIRGLWRGFAALSAGLIPAQILYMGAYEVSREKLGGLELLKASPSAQSFVAGGLASLASQVLTVPADTVASRLVVQRTGTVSYAYKGALDALLTVRRREGVGALYRGLAASTLTHVPYSSIWWGVYSASKAALYKVARRSEGTSSGAVDTGIQAVSALTAASTAVLCTNPIDVCKTRMQTKTGGAEAAAGSLLSNVRALLRDEGLRGAFKGANLRVMQAAPFSVLTGIAYEFTRRVSRKKDLRDTLSEPLPSQ
jgi:hypothetical protein